MNNLDGVMVIGLTGQTGSGKTTACRIFRENGFAVINADGVARTIMETGSTCLREVAECFGTHIIREDGSLDRQKLADYLCVERAAMSVELSKLQKEGILKTNINHFELNCSINPMM